MGQQSVLQTGLMSLAIMVVLFLVGLIVQSRKHEHFRAYLYYRLGVWAFAAGDGHMQRAARHKLYLVAAMDRLTHEQGELKAWGDVGLTAPVPASSDAHPQAEESLSGAQASSCVR